VAAEQVHSKMHNFFVNRITDPIEISMPIKDVCQLAVEKRTWNDTRVAMVMMDG
jgi:hypothetical protein